jgi:hypothetical protein
MTEPKWWLEYRCPECDYTTTVTDVCRKCMRAMMPTGYETLLTKKLREKRRKVTEDSWQYDTFLFKRGIARLECKRKGEALPTWYPDFIVVSKKSEVET